MQITFSQTYIAHLSTCQSITVRAMSPSAMFPGPNYSFVQLHGPPVTQIALCATSSSLPTSSSKNLTITLFIQPALRLASCAGGDSVMIRCEIFEGYRPRVMASTIAGLGYLADLVLLPNNSRRYHITQGENQMLCKVLAE